MGSPTQQRAEEEQIQEEAGEGQEADAQTVEEAGAEASEEENENTAAEEEIPEAASGEETEETVDSEEGDSAVTEEAAAAEDAEAPENADADVAAAELTAEEAAAAAAQAQEEVFTAGELVYHGHDYDVTLAYDENAKIPATAESRRELPNTSPTLQAQKRQQVRAWRKRAFLTSRSWRPVQTVSSRRSSRRARFV